jgi:hypothetical protein
MFKQVLAAAALVLVAGAARADDTMTSPQMCFAAVDGLAQSWENHKYASKAESDKIGTALSGLEKQCESNQLAEAQKSIAELKVMIER